MNLPSAFEEKMKYLLGTEYDDYLNCFDEPRHYGLRINTAKISVEDFLKISPWPLEKVPWIHNGFYYDGENCQPAKHPYYYAGLYYLQEPSAMTPADRLPIEPGDRVLDVCAAPGGKATELGARLNGTGVLAANDLSNSRAKGLLKNIELMEKAKISKSTFYKMKNGENITTDVLLRVCDVLGCDVSDIVECVNIKNGGESSV